MAQCHLHFITMFCYQYKPILKDSKSKQYFRKNFSSGWPKFQKPRERILTWMECGPRLSLVGIPYILLLLPLIPEGVVQAPTWWAVHHSPSVTVICQSLGLPEWFLGMFIMWHILGILTQRRPSLSRIPDVHVIINRNCSIMFWHSPGKAKRWYLSE